MKRLWSKYLFKGQGVLFKHTSMLSRNILEPGQVSYWEAMTVLVLFSKLERWPGEHGGNCRYRCANDDEDVRPAKCATPQFEWRRSLPAERTDVWVSDSRWEHNQARDE